MGYHNILSRSDKALVAYIIAEGAGTAADTFPLKRSLPKTVPCTIVESRRAIPQIPYSGNYTVFAMIKVRHGGVYDTDGANLADQPRADSDLRTSATFDLFFWGNGQDGEDLGTRITAAAGDPDFTCTSCMIDDDGVEQGFERIGAGWCDLLHLKLECAPSTIL